MLTGQVIKVSGGHAIWGTFFLIFATQHLTLLTFKQTLKNRNILNWHIIINHSVCYLFGNALKPEKFLCIEFEQVVNVCAFSVGVTCLSIRVFSGPRAWTRLSPMLFFVSWRKARFAK
jgi:hypothetical protein